MNEQASVELKSAIHIHQTMSEYRDMQYLNMMKQINSKAKTVLTDDMGSQFVENCGRDLVGEAVRQFFDTSSYNITVDQLATRILKFSYENEYDPLAENGGVGEIQKSVYNYNELSSAELDKISADIDASQEKLFIKVDGKYEDNYMMQSGKNRYAASRTNADGTINDDYTNQAGGRQSATGEKPSNRLEVDHVQSANQATYNSRYLSEKGVEELKIMMNSEDNFAMMAKVANASKGDVKVYEKNGKVLSPDEVRAEKREIAKRLEKETGVKNPKKSEINAEFEKTAKNITSRATPEQLAEAVCDRWENAGKDATKEELRDKGYLNEDGKVPKAVQQKLVGYFRHSQNKESAVILEHSLYGEAAKDAARALVGGREEPDPSSGENTDKKGKYTKGAIGKIIAGQIIYYTAPPLVYEIRTFLKDKKAKLDDVLERLSEAAKRIGNYVLSKLKDMFKNILFNSLKKFIKSFMDILINTVKATVKKLLRIAKNLVLSTVDAVRIIADPNASAAEKADSCFNLFGVTITNCVIEVLFELAADALHIPEPFDDIIFAPLQILVTVVCTNLTMLILQKADLFDVRFGFKLQAVKKIFEEERTAYAKDMEMVERYGYAQTEEIINMAKEESIKIYNDLQELDPKKQSVRGQLNSINRMFSMNIDFDAEWLRFMGIDKIPIPAEL